MISANTVISSAETNLNLIQSGSGRKYQRPLAMHRLSLLVQQAQTRWKKMTVSENITTQAGVGTYEISDETFDQIRHVVWPDEWIGYGSNSGTHTRGSDITSDVLGDGYGPKWVPRNELLRLQQLADEGGVGSAYPFAWTHYRDENNYLNIQIADSGVIEAGLTIKFWFNLTELAQYLPGGASDSIPLPSFLTLYLTYALTAQLALLYDREIFPIYKKLSEEEFELQRREHAITEWTGVKTTDRRDMPPEDF